MGYLGPQSPWSRLLPASVILYSSARISRCPMAPNMHVSPRLAVMLEAGAGQRGSHVAPRLLATVLRSVGPASVTRGTEA